jgi:serine/threonine protein kinase
LTNEIVILQNLNHLNIVKFKEVKKTKKNFYIIMEYCNGGELSKILENYIKNFGKPFPEEIVQHFMRQILDAFKYMHDKQIIHYNIKLDNILLNYDDETDKDNFDLMKATIKIIDFGFACTISTSNFEEETYVHQDDPYKIFSPINKKKYH